MTGTKNSRTFAAVAAAALLTVGFGAAIELQAAQPDKKIQITCGQGWRGGAGGTYGGVPFNISCDNGRSTQNLSGTAGTAYSFRMGVENESIGADCFFSGDSENVNEVCVEVRLTIK